MAPVEIQARDREAFSGAAESECALVTRGTNSGADAPVVLAVWVGEQLARTIELVLDSLLRFFELACELCVAQSGQVWMRDRVRPDRDTVSRQSAKLVPGHCPQSVEVLRIVTFELWDEQGRTTVVGVAGTGEDRDRDAQVPHLWKNRLDASKGVIEGDLHTRETPDRPDLTQ